MTDKQQALTNIAALARRYKITLAEIETALGEPENVYPGGQSNIMQTLFSYLGGLFVFAGLCVFIIMFWDGMNTLSRLVVTLFTGFSAYLLALVFLREERFEKAVTPLLLIAGFLQPTGLFVLLDAFTTDGDPLYGTLFVAGIMSLQQGGTFAAKKRTVLAFTSLIFLAIFFTTLLYILDWDDGIISLIIGTGLISSAYYLASTPHAVLAPFGYFVGAACALWGSYDILADSVVEVLFPGIAAGLIYLSTAARSRTLLFVSSLALLCYIGYFSAGHFPDSVGWPLTLIVFGFIMSGLGAVVFRLNRALK